MLKSLRQAGARPCRRTRRIAPVTLSRCVRGFTLIELIVTVTLVGILLAAGLPAFQAWISNAQVRTVAEALQTGIKGAQAEALRRNRQAVLAFTDATPGLNVSAVAGGKRWSTQTVAQFGEAAEFAGGGSLADVASTVAIAAAPSTSALCFNSNGRLVTNNAPGLPGAACSAAATRFDITRSGADRPLRVTVSLGGQVRMCDPSRPALSAATPDGC